MLPGSHATEVEDLLTDLSFAMGCPLHAEVWHEVMYVVCAHDMGIVYNHAQHIQEGRTPIVDVSHKHRLGPVTLAKAHASVLAEQARREAQAARPAAPVERAVQGTLL
jgi:hypothetical protein